MGISYCACECKCRYGHVRHSACAVAYQHTHHIRGPASQQSTGWLFLDKSISRRESGGCQVHTSEAARCHLSLVLNDNNKPEVCAARGNHPSSASLEARCLYIGAPRSRLIGIIMMPQTWSAVGALRGTLAVS